MGQQQSKDELLYQQVSYGNTEGIKALCREGARLEWMDRDGKTPLILACMNPELFNVVKTLIELGANVNAYRPGRNAGTPLHHAAKRGLDSTVKLLLTHGANPLILNDDCLSALEVARAKGFSNVVRTIENHICLFSGWLREFYGPGFLELFSTQLVTRKVWAVIVPTGTRNHLKPYKLELAVYSSLQDAQPRNLIALWKANLEDPKFHQSDPSVTIVDNPRISRGRRRRRARRRSQLRQTRYKFAPANEGDKQQLQWFCDACKGIPQATRPPAFLQNAHQAPTFQATAPPSAEDLELAMAINASIQSAAMETPIFAINSSSEATASTSWNNNLSTVNHDIPVAPSPQKASSGQQVMCEPASDGNSIVQTVDQSTDSVPSAPPVAYEIVEDGPIHYPSVDFSPIDISASTTESVPPVPPVDSLPASTSGKKDGEGSSCVICLDAPVEGACIPCGHMAGCMSCLKEIKAKKWGCPVCRAEIDQVVRLFAV